MVAKGIGGLDKKQRGDVCLRGERGEHLVRKTVTIESYSLLCENEDLTLQIVSGQARTFS